MKTRPRLATVLFTLVAFLALTSSALVAQAAAPSGSAVPLKSKCKSQGHGASICKGGKKKPKKVLFAYGVYTGTDPNGAMSALVSKLGSGPYAGKIAVQVSTSAYMIEVTCSDGSKEGIHPAATGFVHGKSFSRAYKEGDNSFSISGSFTSVKKMKGIYSVSTVGFGGATCSSGPLPFTATWNP